jgi:hypothetical protein
VPLPDQSVGIGSDVRISIEPSRTEGRGPWLTRCTTSFGGVLRGAEDAHPGVAPLLLAAYRARSAMEPTCSQVMRLGAEVRNG